MQVEPQQLKTFLLDAGIITEKHFEECLKEAQKTNKKIDDILVSKSLISEEELIKLKAYILGIPFINLEKEKIPREILKLIPEPIAMSYNIFAFRKKEDNLEVAMLDPENLQIIDFIKKTTNLKILPRLTNSASIKNISKQYEMSLDVEIGKIISEENISLKQIKEEITVEEKEELKKTAEELPIIKIVDTIIKKAILERATDIHIEPTEKEIIIRYRIDGILQDAMHLPKTFCSGIIARIKILSDLKLDEHRLPQDGRFKVETENYRYSIRVSILPVFDGEKIVMRLLHETSKAPTLEKLGLRSQALEQVQDNLKKPVGMILITGPTGCGKTTTLYTMLEILNTPKVNISTIEDPIEYRMPKINQTQVNPKIGLTFANGLRSLLRQDPNIIMVGEIRDNETAGLAINAALTGHLVLSTLHTTAASGAVVRLLDMKVEPFLISSTLNIILAQRLVRCLCADKEKYTLTAAEIKNLEKHCDLNRILKILKDEKIIKPNLLFKDIEFYKPKPTKECLDGYKGRIGIYEVLTVTDSIKELIMKGANSDQIQDQAQKEGMITMIEDGFIKAAQGITSIEEVLRVIIE